MTDNMVEGRGSRQERPRLVPVPWSRIHTLPKRQPLVPGLLDRGAMSVIYGDSNTGKTFFALDLFVRPALKWPWRGKDVQHGAIVYIAVEGGLGIEERLTAFRVHHGAHVEGVPFYVIPEPIDLCRSVEDARLLLSRIAELPAEPKVEAIVVDTVSRALAGGNENSSDDMGRFVANGDLVRLATGAHLCNIHHSGKDATKGARGHSLLRAAADTEIEVTKDESTGTSTAKVVKQRDHATGAEFSFKLEQVELGQTEDGEPITSCVVADAMAPAKPAKTSKAGRPSKAGRIALRALQEALDACGEPAPPSNYIPHGVRVVTEKHWRTYAYKMNISEGGQRAQQKAFKDGSEDLIAAGTVRIFDCLVWLTAQRTG